MLWIIAPALAQEQPPATEVPLEPPPAPEAPVEPPPAEITAGPDPTALARFENERLVREAPNVVGGYAPVWIVRYPGGAPMNTPTFLQTVGSIDQQQKLHRLQQRDLNTGIGLAIAGSTLEVIGVVMMSVGGSLAGAEWSTTDGTGNGVNETALIATGGVLFLGGFPVYYACALPFIRHSRREKHPSLMLSAEEADRLIEGYHTELKAELGLP